jgi:hypothetical protein
MSFFGAAQFRRRYAELTSVAQISIRCIRPRFEIRLCPFRAPEFLLGRLSLTRVLWFPFDMPVSFSLTFSQHMIERERRSAVAPSRGTGHPSPLTVIRNNGKPSACACEGVIGVRRRCRFIYVHAAGVGVSRRARVHVAKRPSGKTDADEDGNSKQKGVWQAKKRHSRKPHQPHRLPQWSPIAS